MNTLFASLIALAASAGVAHAHAGADHAHGLVTGMLHPWGGLDHMIAMIAVGLLAYGLGGKNITRMPLWFLALMIVGFAAAAAGLPLIGVEIGITASTIVIAGLAANGHRLPPLLCFVLVGGFGLFHGHAHGAEMPLLQPMLPYVAGFLFATAVLHAAGLLAAAWSTRAFAGRGRTGFRFLASLLTLCGLTVALF